MIVSVKLLHTTAGVHVLLQHTGTGHSNWQQLPSSQLISQCLAYSPSAA